MPRDRHPLSDEIYFEFTPVGGQVRVAAIDSVTGVEVVIFGPVSASQTDLEGLALRKLRKRIEKKEPVGKQSGWFA